MPARKVRKEPPAKSRLSRKMRQAIELWISGTFKTQKELCNHVNMSEAWFSRVVGRDDVTALIIARTRQRMAQSVPVAQSRLEQLLAQDDNRGVAKDAVLYTLGTVGIAPARGPGIQINIATGLDINLD